MTRAEKKCLAFSLGAHSLLVIVLLCSAAFETMPKHSNMQVLSMVPSRILDNSGVGGGNPQAAETPPPQMQQVTPQPPQPQPQQQPQPAPPTPQPVVQAKLPPPEPVKHEEARVEPKPVEREVPDTHSALPTPKPPRKQHEIKPDFTPYNATTKSHAKPKLEDNTEANAAAAQAAAAQARRDRAVRQALNSLSSGLEAKASQHSIVDVHGDGGESYADYGTVIRSIYYNAWATPDNVANKLAEAKVKLVLARDGSVISAEIISGSGDKNYDGSVERALRAVTHFPPFPSESHDQQRTFFISFTPKDATG